MRATEEREGGVGRVGFLEVERKAREGENTVKTREGCKVVKTGVMG